MNSPKSRQRFSPNLAGCLVEAQTHCEREMELHNQLFSTYRKITEPLSQRHLQLISEIARALETRNHPRKITRKVWKCQVLGLSSTRWKGTEYYEACYSTLYIYPLSIREGRQITKTYISTRTTRTLQSSTFITGYEPPVVTADTNKLPGFEIN